MVAPIQITLGLLNWLHLVATVTWFGGVTTNVLLVAPSLGVSLEPPAAGKFMNEFMKKFRPLVYVSIIVLVATGAILTWILDPLYLGLASEWAIVLTIKHIVIAIAIIGSLYSFEVLGPKAAKLAAQGPSPELAQLQRIQMNAARMGFILVLLILLLTGLQTAL
ncbi:DUF4149 domain-containing protein [Candidatus Bathyarchaeota archaeon]|nr:DUF4149 domain-containing protein [Candidatus Bathyarchaeota archaeon]